MVDWVFLESYARELFMEANLYGVKADDIKIKDIRSFAKKLNINFENFNVAVSNHKCRWNDDLS